MKLIRKRILIFSLLFLVVIALLAGLAHWRMNYSLIPVIPGELYRSPELPPDLLARAAQKKNIKTVIDLRVPDSDKRMPAAQYGQNIIQENQALSAVGINHISLPTGQVPPEKVVDRFLEVLDDPETRPVLIHCYHGVGRAGLFVAVYLMEYAGYTNEEARRNVARHHSLRLEGRKGFRTDSSKGSFIMNYIPRHERMPHSFSPDFRPDPGMAFDETSGSNLGDILREDVMADSTIRNSTQKKQYFQSP